MEARLSAALDCSLPPFFQLLRSQGQQTSSAQVSKSWQGPSPLHSPFPWIKCQNTCKNSTVRGNITNYTTLSVNHIYFTTINKTDIFPHFWSSNFRTLELICPLLQLTEFEHTNLRVAEWGKKRLIPIIIKVKDRMLLHFNPFQTLSFRFTSQEPVCIKVFSVTWEGSEGMGGGGPTPDLQNQNLDFNYFPPGDSVRVCTEGRASKMWYS